MTLTFKHFWMSHGRMITYNLKHSTMKLKIFISDIHLQAFNKYTLLLRNFNKFHMEVMPQVSKNKFIIFNFLHSAISNQTQRISAQPNLTSCKVMVVCKNLITITWLNGNQWNFVWTLCHRAVVRISTYCFLAVCTNMVTNTEILEVRSCSHPAYAHAQLKPNLT